MITVYFRNLGDGSKEVSIHNGRKLVVVDLDKKTERWFWNWCLDSFHEASVITSMTVFRFNRTGK